MSERSFQMRLFCRYEEPDNSLAQLDVQSLEDGEWRDLDLNTGTPGFLIFVYAAFTCQHLYLRANCAERGLFLESASGSIHMLTDEDWDLRKVRIVFEGKLKSGTPSSEDVAYIVGRMRQCPVSKNIREIADSATSVHLD